MGRLPVHDVQPVQKLTRMWERHKEMARLLLLGLTNKQVANRLGCTPQNVSDVRNSEVFKDYMSGLTDQRDESLADVNQTLAEEAPESLELLRAIRKGYGNPDIRLRAQVAQDLLDRAGVSKITKSEQTGMIGIFSSDEINSIKRNAIEAVDVEVEDVE